jgi:hypothetical protein
MKIEWRFDVYYRGGRICDTSKKYDGGKEGKVGGKTNRETRIKFAEHGNFDEKQEFFS